MLGDFCPSALIHLHFSPVMLTFVLKRHGCWKQTSLKDNFTSEISWVCNTNYTHIYTSLHFFLFALFDLICKILVALVPHFSYMDHETVLLFTSEKSECWSALQFFVVQPWSLVLSCLKTVIYLQKMLSSHLFAWQKYFVFLNTV